MGRVKNMLWHIKIPNVLPLTWHFERFMETPTNPPPALMIDRDKLALSLYQKKKKQEDDVYEKKKK